MDTPVFKIVLSVLFCSISILCNGQTELGQNKRFVVKENSECIVEVDWEEMIIFDCSGATVFYSFNDYGLCDFMGMDLPKSSLRD